MFSIHRVARGRSSSQLLLRRKLSHHSAAISSSTILGSFQHQLPQKLQEPLQQPLRQQQEQRRWSSNQSARGPQPRRRFYKQVGVTEVAPPWETRISSSTTNRNSNKTKTTKKQDTTIDNPISAGVDGTQSASGVIGHLPEAAPGTEQLQQFRERLIPRCTTLATAPIDPSELPEPPQWYAVTLDGRTLRTPVGQILSLPSRVLAWAVAAEWDAQRTQIKPVQMPLMTLCCTTLDQTASHMEFHQDTALQYLPTDTVGIIYFVRCWWLCRNVVIFMLS